MRKLLTLILFLSCSLPLFAFQRDSLLHGSDTLRPQKVSLDWGVSLHYVFDNSEYYKSGEIFETSRTVHGVVLTPSVGVAVPQGEKVVHRVRVGMVLKKLAGEDLPVSELFDEFQLYYDVCADLRNGGRFEALAGCFPRAFFAGPYTGSVFDRVVPFLDSSIDGMLFKYCAGGVRAELGLDWLGMFADAAHPERRERFQILSSGDWAFAGPFHLLWTGMFYHYACSLVADGVVDNHQLTPMLEWRPQLDFCSLSLSAGPLMTYQYDRKNCESPLMRMGLHSVQQVEKWRVNLSNRLYFGPDQQPYFGTYGPELYPGSPMFHTCLAWPSLADELVLSYCPHIADWLDLGVYAIFSFGTPDAGLGTKVYRGCRQFVSLKFNLERFRF